MTCDQISPFLPQRSALFYLRSKRRGGHWPLVLGLIQSQPQVSAEEQDWAEEAKFCGRNLCLFASTAKVCENGSWAPLSEPKAWNGDDERVLHWAAATSICSLFNIRQPQGIGEKSQSPFCYPFQIQWAVWRSARMVKYKVMPSYLASRRLGSHGLLLRPLVDHWDLASLTPLHPSLRQWHGLAGCLSTPPNGQPVRPLRPESLGQPEGR